MRLHLTLALITVLALVITLRSEKLHQFTFAQVDEMAWKKAQAKPYVGLPDALALPPQLKKLTPQQDAGIFWKDKYRLWRKKGLPFQVDFYHQLASNPSPHIAPEINTVDGKGSHPLAYSPSFFYFLNFAVKPPAPLEFNPPLLNDLGYAGFYIRYPDMGIGSNSNSLDGFFSVLGGSYFRAIAREQVYGISARGIAINTDLAKKGAKGDEQVEEFPNFSEWWLNEPSDNYEITLYALLDGPSVTGAYEFNIHPGAVTVVDIHASLYFRQAVERLGISPFSSMFLYGQNSKDHFGDDVHPQVHDSDGVLMRTGKDEWVWHPLQQTTFLQAYSYLDENPKGFGLLQRDRDFQHYQDLPNKYNVRPSAWVTPREDWGKGRVELIQSNSSNVNTDNVAMFWWPDQPVKAGDHRNFELHDRFLHERRAAPSARLLQADVDQLPRARARTTATAKNTSTSARAHERRARGRHDRHNRTRRDHASAGSGATTIARATADSARHHPGAIPRRFRRQRDREHASRPTSRSRSHLPARWRPGSRHQAGEKQLRQFMARHLHRHPGQGAHPDRHPLPAPSQQQAHHRNLELHMASMNELPQPEAEAWNQAYDRLLNFLRTFQLGEHAHVSEVALTIFRQAKEAHRDGIPSRDPTTS